MGRGIGCIALLALVAWIGVEIIIFYEVSVWMNRTWESVIGSGGWIICVAWTVLGLVAGIKLGKWHASRIIGGLLTGAAGRHIVGLIGAVLIAIPGILSDIPGLVLLLPPVQRMLGRVGAAVLAVVIKRTMGKVAGGGLASMMGKVPGGGANPFPGMKPLTPDDRAGFGKPGKIIDTTVEKD